MNLSAYFTTGLAIKLLSRLSRASIVVHGKEEIPPGPTIFVVNHFTRIETFLLPSYIYNLTGKPALSLAAASLFKGPLGAFLDMVGTVSTADPKRDELILKKLLTGEANWVIFPEGSMVKTKKIIAGGKFMIASPKGLHEPHTGAAALALKAELYRTHLLKTAKKRPDKLPKILRSLELASLDEIQRTPVAIQPINLTYYPIRAAENIASNIASKLVKDISERMVEEIMAEGTMLLSGVDLDIRCGEPIQMTEYVDERWLQDIDPDVITGFAVSPLLKRKMRKTAYHVMQRYMQDIYAMTTVNHDHLFASFLRMYPFKRIDPIDFRRRVFFAAQLIHGGEEGASPFYLHKSLKENQAHLLTDDRYSKYENFLNLALEKGVVKKDGDYLVRDRSRLSAPLSFHKGRISNPIEIMANEVEPLKKFQSTIKTLAWRPENLLRFSLSRHLLKQEKERYAEDCQTSGRVAGAERICDGTPFLLPGLKRRLGLVLIHSYLAVPEEVKALARYLRRRGVWVYAPRLPGHGTRAQDLAGKKYQDWIETVENGYVLMSGLCDRVVVGGVGVGGNLALDLAARVAAVAGVFTICSPITLRNYSTNFMPGMDVWNRLLNKMRLGERNGQFLDFSHGNPHVNYRKNPVAGVWEVGEFLEAIEKGYTAISQPVLIVQTDQDPVVDPKAAVNLFDAIGSANKELCLLSDDRHVLANGKGTGKVFRKVKTFIDSL